MSPTSTDKLLKSIAFELHTANMIAFESVKHDITPAVYEAIERRL